MYLRAFIREGDTVIPHGGKVQPAPQQYSVSYDGKLACYEGDPVYCNGCNTWGTTRCVAPFRPHTDPSGRQANLDGDLCICKCAIPPRLKAAHHNRYMSFHENEVAQIARANSWLVNPGHEFASNSSRRHKKVFVFKDSETGKLLANRLFIVDDNGTFRKGETDESGRATIEASADRHISIHLIFRTPQDEIRPER